MATVSFNNAASIIIKALEMQDKASVKGGAMIADAIQQYLDACTIAGVTRDQAGVEAIGTEIRECQVFLDAIAYGSVIKNTITNYANGAMRAYFWQEQWFASAYAHPIKGGLKFVPWGKGAKAEAARLAALAAGGDGEAPAKKIKAGAVTKTNDKALLETFRKAIEQAVILNRFELKGSLIDLACEIDPAFKV